MFCKFETMCFVTLFHIYQYDLIMSLVVYVCVCYLLSHV